MISLQCFEKDLIEFLMCMKINQSTLLQGLGTPPIDSDIGPISTLELSKLCKNKKIIEIQQKKKTKKTQKNNQNYGKKKK